MSTSSLFAGYQALAMTKPILCCLTVAIMLVPCNFVTGSAGTPLDDYVCKSDPHYRWYDTGKRLMGLLPWEKWEGAVLNMTSQGWLSSAEVDCSVWTHHLVVVRPGKYEHKKTALLIVGGGTNSDGPPSAADETLILGATVAVKTKSLAVVLYQVPNQPCHFSAEHPRRGRTEDDLIAYTWAHYLDHPNQTEWPLRLPMTKAVIRAMDTVQSYVAEVYKDRVENFVVAGASKRGWTTWTTAATDNRVVGIVPIVMDTLNFIPNIHHFYRALGGWPVAFDAYYKLNLTANLDIPEFKQLMEIVDPFQYKDRLTMPKLIVTTSNDEFFLIDDSGHEKRRIWERGHWKQAVDPHKIEISAAYFWDDLPGEKHMLILSNTEHSLVTGLLKLLVAIEAFFLSIVEGHELSETRDQDTTGTSFLQMPREDKLQERRPGFGGRPKYWSHINRASGTIDIGTAEKPLKVILWYAYTAKGTKSRDFRWFTADVGNCPTLKIKGFCIQPVFFHHRNLRPSGLDSGKGIKNYYATISFPKEGYGAFFVELRFAGPKVLMPFIFTTGAVVVPDIFPYEDCHGENCKGMLL